MSPAIPPSRALASRVAALERLLEAFRLVLVTMNPPDELEQVARLLGICLSVSDHEARRLIGLPSPIGPCPRRIPVARGGSVGAAGRDKPGAG